MADNLDFLDFVAERLKQESGEPLTDELVALGNKLLADNEGTVEPVAVVTGMALASMKLCEERDPLRYYDFLLALCGDVHDELYRVKDSMKLPVVR